MILFVNPPSRAGVYQSLTNLAAIEPPIWARLLASYCEKKGIETAILDADAEGYDAEATIQKAINANPTLVVVVAHGQQPSASTQLMPAVNYFCQRFKAEKENIPVLVVGGHPAALQVRTLEETGADTVCTGEGPITIYELYQVIKNHGLWDSVPGLRFYNGPGRGIYSSYHSVENVWNLTEEMSGGMWGKLPMEKYRCHNWHSFTNNCERQPYASIYTSLGCPYSCLRGDTIINTVYGNIPIRELAEKYSTVPVYTYKDGDVFIAEARNIQKTGISRYLVRVNFDDGAHIDCTPDHKFLTFKWGNGRAWSTKAVERPIEAQDLKPGMRLRAIRTEIDASGRAVITWGRRSRRHRSRLVMDYMTGKKLTKKEQVHHKDHDRLNDDPSNLAYCSSGSEHLKTHHSMQFSERMRTNNPARQMTQEWRDKITRAQTGLRRSLESRLHYRQSKLGSKNPNFKDGITAGRMSRIKEVNHKVASVQILKAKDDVYCLEVPASGWFFADNVLVKNCSFCNIQNPFREGDKLHFSRKLVATMAKSNLVANSYRMWSPAHVVDEIEFLVEKYSVRNIKIADEMFVLNEKHVAGICQMIIDRGLGDKLNIWCYARVDTLNNQALLDLMRAAGIRWCGVGIESMSEHVRDGVDKNDFTAEDIFKACDRLRRADICLAANFMFGLPDDDELSMQQTLDMAFEIMPEWSNFYCTLAYPGAVLYKQAIAEGWELPASWSGYSHYAYDYLPLRTKHLTAAEVLRFRDDAFQKFYNSPSYQSHVLTKFGPKAAVEIHEMVKIPLKRKLLEDEVRNI